MDSLLLDSLSALCVEGLSDHPRDWAVLAGGRTNAVWVQSHPSGRVVCKSYLRQDSALFSNDPGREARTLRHLEGTGLAPRLIASADAPPAILYHFVDGTTWQGDLEVAARGLRRVHRTLPPEIPKVDHRPSALWASVQGIRSALSSPPEDCPADLSHLSVAPYRPAFLHGDPVPGNMIETQNGVTFIDWQCPCIGDPATDLAVFLSPAMQALYGGRGLCAADRRAFLDSYGEAGITSRYQTLAPLLHWRIALHCLWRAEHGAPDYADAAALEFAFLDSLT